ncbi:MAG: helix-turn-helix domain-containing protein [bacterium]
MNKQLLTVKQVSELINIAPLTIYKLTYGRKIPFVKIGRIVRFDKDKILTWLNSNSYDTINNRK